MLSVVIGIQVAFESFILLFILLDLYHERVSFRNLKSSPLSTLSLIMVSLSHTFLAPLQGGAERFSRTLRPQNKLQVSQNSVRTETQILDLCARHPFTVGGALTRGNCLALTSDVHKILKWC